MNTEKPGEVKVPKDPYMSVYLIVYWLGIGTLMPWNFFLAVNGYWMVKFRDVNNETLADSETKMTDLQMSWGPYLSMAAMIPNVTMLLVNAVIGHRMKVKPLLISSLVVIIVIFVFTDIMTQVNTDTWQTAFMIVTLFTVVIFNIMVAFLQGGLMGTIGKFPSAYMGALVQGQALGGIIAVGVNIMMLAFGMDDVSAAFYDFMVAVAYLFTALVAYLFVSKTEFFLFYAEGAQPTKESNQHEIDQLIEDGNNTQMTVERKKPNFLTVAYTIRVWIVAVFISFMCTLSVFPSITQLAFSTGYEEGSAWSRRYFVPVGCFLIFNVGDFLGRILASWVKWPGPTVRGSIAALLISLSRLAFIPLFMICNVSPQNRSVTSVVFESDTAYLILMVLFSVSNGYMGNICLSFAPKMLRTPEEQGQAASLIVFFLVFGLAIGSALSNVCISLL